MKFDDETELYEGFQAAGTLAMALMESAGIRSYIDSICDFDPSRRILSPGMAVKAIIGPLFGYRYKSALSNMEALYSTAPTDLLFGPKVERECLNDSAFGRALDTLFEADREEMVWKCSEMCAERFGLSSDVFHMDAANFSLYAACRDDEGDVAVPNYCGHAKDGRNDLVRYSMISVTDSNGILKCRKPCGGNTSDVIMDREMIDFLLERLDPSVSTIVADSKLTNMETLDILMKNDLGFVTKCPADFDYKVKEWILERAEGKMVDCKNREGAKTFDIMAESSGHLLRFVVYSLKNSKDNSVDFYRANGEKRLNSLFGSVLKTEFSCESDAKQALENVISKTDCYAYEVNAEVVSFETKEKRTVRGRPKKDGPEPKTVTKYKIVADWEFVEDVAIRMGEEHGTHVLITNLPGSDVSEENIRFGATAETVMKTYLDEYKVEHTYRLMKSGLGVNSVYIHTPERENAMIFVIGIATILSNVIDAMFKRIHGKKITFNRLCLKMLPVSIRYDRSRNTVRIHGYQGAKKELFGYLELLGISPELLLGYRNRFLPKARILRIAEAMEQFRLS